MIELFNVNKQTFSFKKQNNLSAKLQMFTDGRANNYVIILIRL